MGGLEQGFELNDEVKWVGYLGCLTLRVIHFEMGSCFAWVSLRGLILEGKTEWVG